MQRRRQAHYGDRQTMQIRKNADGSYMLICCAKQLWTVRNALASYIYEAPKDADEERGRFNAKLSYDMCNHITVYSDAHKLREIGAHCRNCAALFDNDHPKCKANK